MITFAPTPIGNPQDITIRTIKLFEQAELFLCEDTRETKRLLRLLEDRFDMSYPDVKFISFNEHNGKSRLAELKDELLSKEIVYVSDAGMPIVSDPGQLLVEYCQLHNIKYDVLPGASAVATAYAASGFDGSRFTFIAFLPHKGSDRSSALFDAMNINHSVVLFESPHRLEKLLNEICSIAPDREIFLAKELTKKYQRYYKGKASDIKDELAQTTIRGEWVVVLSPSAKQKESISFDEIMSMSLPPKVKAKLLAITSKKSVKEWYEILTSQD